MIAVHDWIEAESAPARLVLQVHDELVLEVPEGELDAIRVELPGRMAGVIGLAVPLLAEVGAGPNWERAH
jgi:DNA polymerase-1